MANVSSYNSAGCGGCGSSGGNAFPAFSRLFVNSIEPCVNDGTISLNLGQVQVNGSTDTTTVQNNLVAGTITSTGDLTIDTNVLRVKTDTNKVGINIVTPTEALDVVGNIKASGTITTTGDLTVDTNVLKVRTDFNRVGINTSNPTEALDVFGNANISGDLLSDYVGAESIAATSIYQGAGNSDFLDGQVSMVYSTGNVGIGTSNPTEKLEIVGSLKVSGGIVGNSLGSNIVTTPTLNVSGNINTTNTAARTAGSIGYIQKVNNSTSLGTITAGASNTQVTATLTINEVGVYLFIGKVHLGLSSSTSNTITRFEVQIRDDPGTTTLTYVGGGPYTLVAGTNPGVNLEISLVETVTTVPHVRKLYMLYNPTGTNLNSTAQTGYFQSVKIA